jgi:hypothetical protein
MSMRKTYKVKKRSCKMCKPHKMGWSVRWKVKELAALKRFEKEAKRG